MDKEFEERYKVLGLNIQYYRKKKGLNQDAIAAMVNADVSHIGGIEQGRKAPSIDLIYKIADALCVTESQLFERRD